MFIAKSIFKRSSPQNSPRAGLDDNATTYTATSIKSDDTPKSILRRQGSERNTLRNVSWSTTYETLEHDDTSLDNTTFDQYTGLDDATTETSWKGTFETRDAAIDTRVNGTGTDGASTYDYSDSRSTFETREATTFETRDAATFETRDTKQIFGSTASTGTNDSLESVDANATDPAGSSSLKSGEGIEHTITQMENTKAGQEQEQEVLDKNENLDFKNIACAASNVTEASELVDRYGLNEKDAKRGTRLLAADSCVSDGESVFGDKYHGLEDESMDEVAVRKSEVTDKQQDETEDEIDLAPMTTDVDAPPTVEVDIPVNESQDLFSPISVDAASVFVPGEASPIEDEYIQESFSADSLTMGTLSEEQLSQSYEENDNISLKANSDEGSLASLKKKPHEYDSIFHYQNTADRNLGHIGLILPFLNRLQCGAFTENDALLDVVHIESNENESTEDAVEESESLEEEPEDLVSHEELTNAESNEKETELFNEKVHGTQDDIIEYQIESDGNINVRVNGEDASESVETGENSQNQEMNTLEDEMSQTSDRSDESPHIGEIVEIPVAEDDSIPSNESRDDDIVSRKKKKGFRPLASLRKRVSRAASSIVGKNTKSKNQPLVRTNMYDTETLHDRVYHNNVPAMHSHVSTELILDDLKIIENTAKVMYHDRFNNSPSLLNPSDEILQGDVSMVKSKRTEMSVDVSSQKSKATVQSSLSPMFRNYFAVGHDN